MRRTILLNKTTFFEKLDTMSMPCLRKETDMFNAHLNAYWILEDEKNISNKVILPGVKINRIQLGGKNGEEVIKKYEAREKAMEEKYNRWIDEYYGWEEK